MHLYMMIFMMYDDALTAARLNCVVKLCLSSMLINSLKMLNKMILNIHKARRSQSNKSEQKTNRTQSNIRFCSIGETLL